MQVTHISFRLGGRACSPNARACSPNAIASSRWDTNLVLTTIASVGLPSSAEFIHLTAQSGAIGTFIMTASGIIGWITIIGSIHLTRQTGQQGSDDAG
ncbi:hypothetical protein PCASD_06846 [Puccinia coronata f. sp. avenae]|uniref:Uncharacterized protein n=1 Tax=Puccinia coronata f. sp. avenae TaxID=200324 RepID=A0A2N5UQD0_9BASI|nr:hypothetical protein PCASD_06846 [Puccinia coronata f. sp. avenae]